MEARRREEEKLSRRSRSPECAATAHPGNRSRRPSKLDACGCWDCKKRSGRELTTEEHREEAGPRRMRVQVTWTPEARSRTGSRSGSPSTPRGARSPTSRSASPPGHTRFCASSCPEPRREDKQEFRRRARILDELKRLRHKKDKRIEEVLRQNFGARCRFTRMPAKEPDTVQSE